MGRWNTVSKLTWILTWAIAFAPLVGRTVSPTAAAAEPRPNVLFIVVDDLNNHLGCYGYPVHSPSIDRLAQRGMRFDRAYCQVPLCNPSRVSFLSGYRPDWTRVYTLSEPTRSVIGDVIMLPEAFRQHGYFTAQVGKIFHTGEGFEDPRSWDVEIREFGKRPDEKEILKSGRPNGPGGHTIDWAMLKTPDELTPDGYVARKAVHLIEQSLRDRRPFFLGVGFRRPHAPYAAPSKYFDRYPPAEITLPVPPPAGHIEQLSPSSINHPPPAKPMSQEETRELIAAYYACTSFVDAQVGVLLDALDRLSLWDDTLIVLLGDHGYHLGEHGGMWHKISLFEESCRVPLIIYAPKTMGVGQSCSQLVELLDLYPTVTAYCGMPTEESQVRGVDLRPLLDDPSRPVKDAAYTLVARSDDPAADHSKRMSYLGRSVRTLRWRYTEWDAGKRGTELYDHDKDANEWHNLADDPRYAGTIAEMRVLLDQELRSKRPADH